MRDNSIRIGATPLRTFASRVFQALDVPKADAEKVAGLMIEADLCGLDTHGIFRLRQYTNRLRDGGTNANANVHVVRDFGAIGMIDGDNGLGHLAMDRATDLAIDKARQFGIGWVGVRNGNHAGPATLYVSRAIEYGQAALYGAVGSANHMPAWGGSELLLGTNPLALAIPAGDSPAFVLDMATSVAAAGKIKTLAQQDLSMPQGWMVGRDGKPLTDPKRQSEGFLLPIGGPKGYGLALGIGLLAGCLNGAAMGRDVVNFSSDTTSPTNTGQFIMALSVEAFGDPDGFRSSVEQIFAELRGSRTLPGHQLVRIPGSRLAANRTERARDGLPLHPNLIKDLNSIAAEYRIEPIGF